MILDCAHIHFEVGRTSILEDVSIEVKAGEVVALCGPNGAGKSTLLRIASGELRPDTGRVNLFGRAIEEWSPRSAAKVRAKLSQDCHLSFSFTVREVVEMGRFPHQTDAQNPEIVGRCMDRVDIAALADRDYTTLSGGEKQRVHMARVLAQLTCESDTSKLLLLDEPTSALDLRHQEVALSLAHDLCREQDFGVLVVLHDLNLAAAWADRIVMLKEGKVLCRGTPEAVLTEEVLRETYDVEVVVLKHPVTDRPIVTINRTQ